MSFGSMFAGWEPELHKKVQGKSVKELKEMLRDLRALVAKGTFTIGSGDKQILVGDLVRAVKAELDYLDAEYDGYGSR